VDQLAQPARRVFYRWLVPYSKSRVNHAGQLWADHLRSAAEGLRRVGDQKVELQEAIQIIDWWRSEHAAPLSRVGSNLHRYAENEGKPVVTQRLKKLPTMLGKLFREPGMKLARMEDIGGVRAVLPNQDAAYRVARGIRKNWTITRFRDYVSNPKADGYRALHLINRNRGRLIEIQLRTPLQDTWANAVEADARLLFPGLKFGGGSQEMRAFYIALGELCAQADQGLPLDPALFERVKDLGARADTFRRESTR
jgi:putative GTP pyrophosphokinase